MACPTWRGESFHKEGAVTEKAQCSWCFRLDLGFSRSSWSADLRHQAAASGWRNSHSSDNKRIWKLTVKCTGGQWGCGGETRMGVMCSLFHVSLQTETCKGRLADSLIKCCHASNSFNFANWKLPLTTVLIYRPSLKLLSILKPRWENIQRQGAQINREGDHEPLGRNGITSVLFGLKL